LSSTTQNYFFEEDKENNLALQEDGLDKVLQWAKLNNNYYLEIKNYMEEVSINISDEGQHS